MTLRPRARVLFPLTPEAALRTTRVGAGPLVIYTREHVAEYVKRLGAEEAEPFLFDEGDVLRVEFAVDLPVDVRGR